MDSLHKKASKPRSPSNRSMKQGQSKHGMNGGAVGDKKGFSISDVYDPYGGLNSDEWSCVVVMLEEGCFEYTRYIRLITEGINDGCRRHVACISLDQIKAAVKRPKHIEEQKKMTTAAKNSQGQLRMRSPQTIGGTQTPNAGTTGGTMADQRPSRQPEDVARETAETSRQATMKHKSRKTTQKRSKTSTMPRGPIPVSSMEEALNALRMGQQLSAKTVASLIRAELEHLRDETIRTRIKEEERRRKAHTIDFLSDKPILETVFEGEKEHTRLRKRGAPVARMTAIEDQPEFGLDLYVVLTGFHMAELPVELLRHGVPLRAVFLLISELDEEEAFEAAKMTSADGRTNLRSWPFVRIAANQMIVRHLRESDMAQEIAAMEAEHAETQAAAAAAAAAASPWGSSVVSQDSQGVKSNPRRRPQEVGPGAVCCFWPQMESVMWDKANAELLRDVAMMTITFPDCIMKEPDETIKNYLYDEVSFAAYDMFMMERVWKSLQERMTKPLLKVGKKLSQINESHETELYRTVTKALPCECWDVPLRMRAILQQVEQWTAQKGMHSILAEEVDVGFISLVDVVKSDLQNFLDNANKLFEPPDVMANMKAFPDPLVLVQGDSVLQRAYHVHWAHGDVSTATVEVLRPTTCARAWDFYPDAPREENDPFRRFLTGLSQRLHTMCGVRAACADSIVEMLALARLPCSMGQRPDETVRSAPTSAVTETTGERAGEMSTVQSSLESRGSCFSASTCPSAASAPTACNPDKENQTSNSNSTEKAAAERRKKSMWSKRVESRSVLRNRMLSMSLVEPPPIADFDTVDDLLRFLLDASRSYDDSGKDEQIRPSDSVGGKTSNIGDSTDTADTQERLDRELSKETPEPLNAHLAIDAHRFARERSPNVLLQQLFEAQVEYECFDVAYFRPTDVLLVRAHNPVDSNGIWFWKYNGSLPTCRLGLREFGDNVLDEEPEWVELESQRLSFIDNRKAQELQSKSVSHVASTPGNSKSSPSKTSSRAAAKTSTKASINTRGTTSSNVSREMLPESSILIDQEEPVLLMNSLKWKMKMGDPDVHRIRSRTKGLQRFSSTQIIRKPGSQPSTAHASMGDPVFQQHPSSTPGGGTSQEGAKRNISVKSRGGKSLPKAERLQEKEEILAVGEFDSSPAPSRHTASLGKMSGVMSPSTSVVAQRSQAQPSLMFDLSVNGYDLGTLRYQFGGERRRFAAADGSSMLVDACDWLFREKTVSTTVTMAGHSMVLHRCVTPYKPHHPHGNKSTFQSEHFSATSHYVEYSAASHHHSAQKKPLAFHINMANGIVIAFSSFIPPDKPPPRGGSRGADTERTSKSSSTSSSLTEVQNTQSMSPTPHKPQPAFVIDSSSSVKQQVLNNQNTPPVPQGTPETSTASNSKDDERFVYHMKMSWPSGLIAEAIKPQQKGRIYIRQYYTSKGPECDKLEFELWRCCVEDGSILKFMDNKRCILMNLNGSVVLCTEFDPPLIPAWPRTSKSSASWPAAASVHTNTTHNSSREPTVSKREREPTGLSVSLKHRPTTSTHRSGRRKELFDNKRNVPAGNPSSPMLSHSVSTVPTPVTPKRRSPKKVGVAEHPISTQSEEKISDIKRRVVGMETVQTDGGVYAVRIPDEEDRKKDVWKQKKHFITRTHTDFERLETLKRRSDDTHMLFKPSGELITHFPDGSRITTCIEDEVALNRRKYDAYDTESTLRLVVTGPSPVPSIPSSTTNLDPKRTLPSTSQPAQSTDPPVTSIGASQLERSKDKVTSFLGEGDGKLTDYEKGGGHTDVTSSTFSRYNQDVLVLAAVAPGSVAWSKKSTAVGDIMKKGLSKASVRDAKRLERDSSNSHGRKTPDKSRPPTPKDTRTVRLQEVPESRRESSKRSSSKRSSTDEANETAVLNASKDDPTCWDEFDEIFVSHTIEHPNFATVTFNNATGMTLMKSPDVNMLVNQDGTYHVELKGVRHPLGETGVVILVNEHKIIMEHRLIHGGDVLCHFEVETNTFKSDNVPPSSVVCHMSDSEGRSFDVLASGETEFRRVAAGDDLVAADFARYFLVQRDLTGLELCTSGCVRNMMNKTREDPRVMILSQQDVHQPDLSHFLSLMPLKTMSERWLMPLEPLRVTTEVLRRRTKRLAILNKMPDFPLRSTYGYPPNWFHPFPLKKRKKAMDTSGDDSDSDSADEDPFAVPDPLIVDLLVELVPYKMRLRRALRNVIKTIARDLSTASDEETFSLRISAEDIYNASELEAPLSEGRGSFIKLDESMVERRRRRHAYHASRVRPTWQDKTTSPAAMNLYNLAMSRRLALSKSEMNLFKRKSPTTASWHRGMAKMLRAEVQDEITRLRHSIRSGRGVPYFQTPRGLAFLEQQAKLERQGDAGQGDRAIQMDQEKERRTREIMERAARRLSTGKKSQPGPGEQEAEKLPLTPFNTPSRNVSEESSRSRGSADPRLYRPRTPSQLERRISKEQRRRASQSNIQQEPARSLRGPQHGSLPALPQGSQFRMPQGSSHSSVPLHGSASGPPFKSGPVQPGGSATGQSYKSISLPPQGFQTFPPNASQGGAPQGSRFGSQRESQEVLPRGTQERTLHGPGYEQPRGRQYEQPRGTEHPPDCTCGCNDPEACRIIKRHPDNAISNFNQQE